MKYRISVSDREACAHETPYIETIFGPKKKHFTFREVMSQSVATDIIYTCSTIIKRGRGGT